MNRIVIGGTVDMKRSFCSEQKEVTPLLPLPKRVGGIVQQSKWV